MTATALIPMATTEPGALREEPPKPMPDRAMASLTSLVTDWPDRAHPGGNLTVARIIQIFRNAESGYPAEQCYLFDDVIERDGHLRSCVEGRIESVAGKPWIVQAGGDDPEDERAAQLLEDALQKVPNMRRTLEHLLTANPYGYAGAEILWELTPDGPIAPVWFQNVEPHRFIFDERGLPRIVVSFDRWKGEELAPGQWIWITRRHWTTSMAGLMRTAVFYALFKSQAFRDWVIANARFGIPFPVGKYPDGMTEPEKTILKQAVAMIGKLGYAVFHEDGNIETIDTKGSGNARDNFGPMIDECNREISKLFTGATLTSGEGTSVGSYALGRVHENVSYQFTSGDAERLGEIFEQHVGMPFIHWNGIKCRPPRLKVHVVKESDPAGRMDLYCRGANELGMELDRDQVYQEFQMKTPTTSPGLKGTKASIADQRPGGGGAQ